MVVSVEISGVLEEKLRRLVELGIYASVSEAVRDAVRNMLSSLDLRKIALNLYLTKGSSLHYACHFSETPCPAFIDYLLIQGHTPGLGYLEEPPEVEEGKVYLLDYSSAYVIYSSTLSSIIDSIHSIEVRVPSVMWNYYTLLRARASRINSKTPRIMLQVPVKERKPPQSLLITSGEYSILKHVESIGGVLVTDDLYIQRIAQESRVSFVPSVSFLVYAYRRGIIGEIEYREALLSLDSIPYSYHASLIHEAR